MARGRKPTPNALLGARGSKHQRKNEPEFTAGLGGPIMELSGVALEEWNRVKPEIEKAGMGSRVEAAALTCYCQAVANYVKASKDLETMGHVVQTERGYTRNPAFINQAAAADQIRRFAIEFGLTPSSRGKIHGKPKAPENDFSDF